ncbi:hypothetical protein PIB30_094943 [Stylosanthes scabra]|uniref:Uncharacterized protein n=1 Tax=Stylosanthes scabra TaxID=79078 RepID=A0ABU6UY36_9FABA|nr:hypothetical protein [Stylosanthes scabra]
MTDEVIRDWEEVCYQRPNMGMEDNCEVGPNTNRMGTNEDPSETGSLSLSVPPGFERLEQSEIESSPSEREEERIERIVNHQDGKRRQKTEKARRKKEGCKRTKLRKIQEEEKDEQWPICDEDIENSEDEIEEIWSVGVKTGLVTNSDERAKKYLASNSKKSAECQTEGRKRCSRSRKQNSSKVGVSQNCSQ